MSEGIGFHVHMCCSGVKHEPRLDIQTPIPYWGALQNSMSLNRHNSSMETTYWVVVCYTPQQRAHNNSTDRVDSGELKEKCRLGKSLDMRHKLHVKATKQT